MTEGAMTQAAPPARGTRIYLDHNATTPVDPRVLARFVEVETSVAGNPGSLHTAGRHARAVVEDARREIARALAVDDADVVFTSGGTEANNIVVLGLGDSTRPVLASAGEHASVLEPARRRGLVELASDAHGRARFDTTPPYEIAPALVCAVYGQSELGSLNDLNAARRCADDLRAALHVDASQALGRVDVRAATASADTVAMSLHKAGGLMGMGLLIVRRSAPELRAPYGGGGQERGVRPGSVSPALAAAAALAVRLSIDEHAERARTMAAARQAFLAELCAPGVEQPRVECLTPLAHSLPNTLMLAFPGVADGRALLPALDLAGVDASHGAACSSGSPLPPLVLRALGHDDEYARRCVRFSFSHLTMIDAAQVAAQRVRAVLVRLARA
jgi:cysteine desulfurase